VTDIRIGSDIILNSHFYFSSLTALYHAVINLSSLIEKFAYADVTAPEFSTRPDVVGTRSNNNISDILRERIKSQPKGWVPENGNLPFRVSSLGSDIMWDRIVSIEYCGYEHVYDIEVEGTHNFIGNGIFAHNTYAGQQPPTADKLKPLDETDETHGLPGETGLFHREEAGFWLKQTLDVPPEIWDAFMSKEFGMDTAMPGDIIAFS
jgi:hypothetical protein